MEFRIIRNSESNSTKSPHVGAYIPDSERGKQQPTWAITINELADIVRLAIEERCTIGIRCCAGGVPMIEIQDR